MQGNVDRMAPSPLTKEGTARESAQDKARRDLLTGAILFAACILFVINGSTAMGQVIDALSGRTRTLVSCFVGPEDTIGRRARTAAMPVRLRSDGIAAVVLPPLSVVDRVALDNAMLL